MNYRNAWWSYNATWLRRMPRLEGMQSCNGHSMRSAVVVGILLISIFAGKDACGQSRPWKNVTTVGPHPRANHGMVYDSARNRMVVYGGFFWPPDSEIGDYLWDTWELDGTTWSLRTTTGAGALTNHARTYDSARGRVVLFGGNVGGVLGNTWEWDGTSWSLR